jgi:hypothetical protein
MWLRIRLQRNVHPAQKRLNKGFAYVVVDWWLTITIPLFCPSFFSSGRVREIIHLIHHLTSKALQYLKRASWIMKSKRHVEDHCSR